MAHVHKEYYHKALQLKFLEDVSLEVTFEDGLVKRFDMSSLFEEQPEYKALENRALFESGQLLSFVIVWNDLLDIETEEIYDCGTTVKRVAPFMMGSVGNPVSTARRSRGLSQAELAEKAAMDQSDISKIERGLANPSVRTLQKIANALNCTLVINFKSNEPDDPLFYPELEDSGFEIR